MNKKMIKVKYKPMFGIRVIEPYQWDEANGYVTEVPLPLAAQLWSYPDPSQFEIAEEDAEKAQAEIENYINGLKPTEEGEQV